MKRIQCNRQLIRAFHRRGEGRAVHTGWGQVREHGATWLAARRRGVVGGKEVRSGGGQRRDVRGRLERLVGCSEFVN
jgi:hypothetical protein